MSLLHSLFATSRNQDGVIGLISVIVYSLAIIVIGGTMVATSTINYNISNKRIASNQSLYNAESGAEDALMQLARSGTYGSSSTTLNSSFGGAHTAQTTIAPATVSGCSPARTITTRGLQSTLQRNIQLTNCGVASTTNISFSYALQAGNGGIQMSNNSTVVGSAYANYNITGGNGARITGDTYVATGVAASPTPSYQPANPVDYLVGDDDQPGRIDAAQSFTADTATATRIVLLSLYVKKYGNPDNAAVRIVTDNNNSPSGTVVSQGTLLTTSVGNSAGYIDVGLTTQATLINGAKYWIVLDSSNNANGHWSWGTGTAYANNKGMVSSAWSASGGGTWVDTSSDFAFKVFMAGSPTQLSNMIVTGNVHANRIVSNTIVGNAYFQTNSGSTIAGSQFPGSADPNYIPLPITSSNIQDFKNGAESGSTWNGNYTVPGNGSATIGPMKINGNLTVGNNATLIMNGTLWVTGTVTLSNNANIQLGSNYNDGTSGALVTDSPITLANNVDVLGLVGNHIMFLTTSTSNSAISINNNATGMLLACPFGTIQVQNNASANAVVANRIDLSNNASIIYVQGLNDVEFSSSAPGGSFEAQGWREVVLN